MIKNIIISLALCLAHTKEQYPMNLTDPHYKVELENISLKYWIFLEPKCLIESTYDKSGIVSTELLVLEPNETNQNQIISLVSAIENETDPFIFGGTNKDKSKMVTISNSGHLILWERNQDTEKIIKVTIIYNPDESLNL
ncbi:hypothetical protein EBS02_03750 [bacterium]|nr:hypothetical protein [bacterium]